MTKLEHFESLQTEHKVEILSNAITTCMISNEMTFAMLDEAYDVAKEVYRKNAVVKKEAGE